MPADGRWDLTRRLKGSIYSTHDITLPCMLMPYILTLKQPP